MSTANPVHIFLGRPEPIGQQATGILDVTERARADTYRFPQDRELYIAAHVLLRQTLSQYAPLEPADWQFRTNAYGKPFIANPGYEYLHFNLSHTRGLIACAVSTAGAIGVDVEERKPLTDLDALCRYALSPLEAHDVLSLSHPEEKAHRFFTYWTLKEAYIKARGMGLSIPLQEFTLGQSADLTWHLQTAPASHPAKGFWQFATQLNGEHHIAVSQYQADATPCTFVFHPESSA